MNDKRFPQKIRPDGTIEHIVQEGARFHVIWWDNFGACCTEPKCEINKAHREHQKMDTHVGRIEDEAILFRLDGSVPPGHKRAER